MAVALIHGAAAFFITQRGLEMIVDKEGFTSSHWLMSTITFSVCIHLATFKLFLESTFWNKINMIAGIASLILYYGMLAMGALPTFAHIFQPQLEGILF